MIISGIVNIVIGKKNKKYLNKYLLIIVVVHLTNKIVAEYVRGDVVTFQSIGETIIINASVLFLGFRIWIKIFEGTQKFWCRVLKIEE